LIREQLAAAVRQALVDEGVPDVEVHLERPARLEHGDWSTNVALASAKRAGRNPRELAAAIVARLESAGVPHLREVEIAGPGFINFRLAPSWLHEVLTDVVERGTEAFGASEPGSGHHICVEMISANPTGPLHAGHARGACYADALANILTRTGNRVQREYYINDRGTQLDVFARSLAAVRAGEPIPEDGYGGEYILEWGAEMPPGADPLEWGYQRALAEIRGGLERLGIHMDHWFSERSMAETGAIEQTLADLRERGVVYDAEGAVWLRSTDFGDDKDRVLVKSDGEYTYILPDIAYHRDKFGRGFDLLIDVFGADHHGYVTRLKAGVAALGHDPDELEVRITQIVRLEREGEEVKLSKRTGELIELTAMIDEVGADATRFTYLLQSIDSQQTVDLAVIAANTMDNPVFYVQMAHARACSIQRKAASEGIATRPLGEVDLSVLTGERELAVLRSLSEFDEVIAMAARERAPHKVTTWVRELAAAFHGFFHDRYVVGEGIPPEVTQARLWLVEAARVGLAVGLGVLGVGAPEKL